VVERGQQSVAAAGLVQVLAEQDVQQRGPVPVL
jgi:hypothetical protein